MTVPVFFSIDTEEDLWDSYRQTDNPVENVACLPTLQRLCDRYGAIPTYLVNYPVASCATSIATVSTLLGQGRCEIGMHCHSWNTPPFAAEQLEANCSMLSNLPQSLVFDKLSHLHDTIVRSFGVTPISFRAGRAGFNSSVALALRNLGYRVDSSVVPFFDLSQYEGPNFENAPNVPYRFKPDCTLESHPEGELLEVQQTIGFLQQNFIGCSSTRKRIAQSFLGRLKLIGVFEVLKVLNLRKLAPEETSLKDMIALADKCLGEGYPALHMVLHSSTLLPGLNPFAPTKERVEEILSRIEGFLRFCSLKGFRFYGLSAALNPQILTAIS